VIGCPAPDTEFQQRSPRCFIHFPGSRVNKIGYPGIVLVRT